MLRMALASLIVTGMAGCAFFEGMTEDKCQTYATLAELLALQIAEQADPASAESKELRERWAAVGRAAAAAGCEHIEE